MRNISNRLSHFFHVVSNIRPIVWIGLYICLTPVFATIYWALPDDQFRIPDNAATDWGSWLYYSIVTITTLGFGDYTPAHGWAQAVTAIEVACGLIFLGFFLNAVGSMKSEIDVESELEKQKRLHFAMEHEKLTKTMPTVIHALNIFLTYCYAVTTPKSKRRADDERYNPDFSFSDLSEMFQPTGLSLDNTSLPAVTRLMKSASHASLTLDTFQSKIDLTLWPQLLENCFGFVANFQMFSNTDVLFSNPSHIIMPDGSNPSEISEKSLSSRIASWEGSVEFHKEEDMMLQPVGELYYFIKENAALAETIETLLTEVSSKLDENA